MLTSAVIPTVVPAAALQAQLDALRVKYHAPGVSVTIIWPDGTTWTGVSGLANLATKAPVVPGTAFSIGSITKTFMAALILQLQQEQRLSLNDRVLKWLPHAKVLKGDTIHELLDQTSGLYDFFANPRIDTAILANKKAHWTAARALRYVRGPYCNPGKCWHYSNSNYVILGQLVRMITRKTPVLGYEFGGAVSFGPLALSRTFSQGFEARRGTVATSYALSGPMATVHRVSLSDGTAISPYTSVVTAAGDAGDMAASSVDTSPIGRARSTPVRSSSRLRSAPRSTSVKHRGEVPLPVRPRHVPGGDQRPPDRGPRRAARRRACLHPRHAPYGLPIIWSRPTRTGPDRMSSGSSLLKIAMAPPPPPPPPPAPEPSPSGDLGVAAGHGFDFDRRRVALDRCSVALRGRPARLPSPRHPIRETRPADPDRHGPIGTESPDRGPSAAVRGPALGKDDLCPREARGAGSRFRSSGGLRRGGRWRRSSGRCGRRAGRGARRPEARCRAGSR